MRRSKKVMENYVCPNCWNQIHKCTCKAYPPWKLIMIDVNIQEIIRTLNIKGYATEWCCESHYDNIGSIYVSFLMDYGIGCPDGFKSEKNNTIVSYMYTKADTKSKEEFERVKAEKLKSLSEWAKSLPENPYIFRRRAE